MQPDNQWFDRHEKSDWLPRKPAGSTAEALTLRLPAMKTANFLAKPLWAQLRQIGDSRHAREPSRARRLRLWADRDFGLISSSSRFHSAFSRAGRNKGARNAIARASRLRNAGSFSMRCRSRASALVSPTGK